MNDRISECDYHLVDKFKQFALRFHTNDNNFSLLHLNTGSLLNKLDEIEQLQSDIDHKFTIIGISKTWLNDRSESFIQLGVYKKYIYI